MRLRNKKTYKSIDAVPADVDLPQFTLLVGPNGAGKSQLLGAIATQHLECLDETGALIQSGEIRLFNWQNFLPRNENVILQNQLDQSRNQVWSQVQNAQREIRRGLLAAKKRKQEAKELLDDSEVLPLYKLEDIKAEISNKENAESIYKWLNETLSQLTETRVTTIEQRHPGLGELLEDIAEDCNVPIVSLTKEMFLERLPIGWTPTDPFTAAITTSFAEYRAAELANRKNRILAREGRTVSHLDQVSFVAKFGRPPWEIINEILETSNLDFRIEEPESGGPVKFALKHDSCRTPLQIADLSSGEQILLGVARCLFFMGSDNMRVLPPKLLLLDEIDAPLHPAMTQQLIDVLTEVVAKRHGIRVILTTHSPTTVALSPDESLFKMQAGAPRISRTSKDETLASLTAGLPTLSFKHENRRQVFVESEYDERIFELVFRRLRAHCHPEISLHFIASGSGGAGSCSQVKALVNSLQTAGNASVRGIVDWDTKNHGNEYIISFGLDSRYSIENYILDPLLVSVLLFRERWVSRSEVQLNEKQNHADLSRLPEDKLQLVANWFVTKTDEKHPDVARDKSPVDCGYVSGVRINLPKWYLLMRGHDLEDLLKETFPELKRFRGEGELKLEVVKKAADDLPSLLSEDFLALFKQLQS